MWRFHVFLFGSFSADLLQFSWLSCPFLVSNVSCLLENTYQFVYPHTQTEIHGSSVCSLSFFLFHPGLNFKEVLKNALRSGSGEKKLGMTATPAGHWSMFVFLSSCVWFYSYWIQAYTRIFSIHISTSLICLHLLSIPNLLFCLLTYSPS